MYSDVIAKTKSIYNIYTYIHDTLVSVVSQVVFVFCKRPLMFQFCLKNGFSINKLLKFSILTVPKSFYFFHTFYLGFFVFCNKFCIYKKKNKPTIFK